MHLFLDAWITISVVAPGTSLLFRRHEWKYIHLIVKQGMGKLNNKSVEYIWVICGKVYTLECNINWKIFSYQICVD